MHRVGTAATTVVALLSGLVANTTTAASNTAIYPADRMGRALLTSSTNTLAAPCTSGEYEACYADPSCKACDEVFGASWETCFDTTSQSTAFGLQGDCDVLMERMCCSIADGDDCYNNALFSDLHGMHMFVVERLYGSVSCSIARRRNSLEVLLVRILFVWSLV